MKKNKKKLAELELKMSKWYCIILLEETKIKREEDRKRQKTENKEAIRILRSVEPMHRKMMEKFHNEIELPDIQNRLEALQIRRNDVHHK